MRKLIRRWLEFWMVWHDIKRETHEKLRNDYSVRLSKLGD